jgi:hypothetical protein
MIYLICSSLFIIGLLLMILSSIAFNKLEQCESQKLKINLKIALCIGSALMAFAASYALCIFKCGCKLTIHNLNMYMLPFVFVIGIYTAVLSKSIMDESKRCIVEIGVFPKFIFGLSIVQSILTGIYLLYLLYRRFKPKSNKVLPLTEAPTSVAPTSVAPTSVAPTSVAPTSVAPTSVAPTSVASTSVASTSVASTSVASTSDVSAPSVDVSAPSSQSTGELSAGNMTVVPDKTVNYSSVSSQSTGELSVLTDSSSSTPSAPAPTPAPTPEATSSMSSVSTSNCDSEELALNQCRIKYPKETYASKFKNIFG